MRTPRPVLVLAFLSMLIAVACSSSAVGSSVTVSDAWVRPPMGAGLPAAGYLTMVGGSEADALIAASSPIASSVEIHETMSGASGMTGMQPVGEIDVASGAKVKLEPGGYHLMLMGVSEAPAVGSSVDITLTFKQAGDITVKAEVKAG